MQRKRFYGLILFAAIALAVTGPTRAAGDGLIAAYPLDDASMLQWRLPGRLKEISGLAMTRDGRLLAMDDEKAVVYEIDYDKGKLVKAFALGDPVARADFEGIAIVDDLVYITTSTGRIFLAAEGADGQRVSFDTYQTGYGEFCEIEGLVQSDDSRHLFFLCKGVRDREKLESLMLFAWSVDERVRADDLSVALPEQEIMKALDKNRFDPSGVTIDRATGNFVIVAARQRAIVEVSPGGELIHAREFPLSVRHRQAEGVELASEGRILVSDEGGSKKGRLAVYYPAAIQKDNDD